MKRGLGTQLRHLLELLDGAVQASYADAGLTYRPRYTPVMRVLEEREFASIGEIAEAAGITQPAVTQTVALMVRDGLVHSRPARHDARVRVVRLARKGRDLLPALRTCWRVTEAAAHTLDGEMTTPLSQALAEAIVCLEAHSFGERLAKARSALYVETVNAD
ncbi:MAG: MarR family transcriptional regulator [Luteitalea sp.]|nr:MarR family transcriptional regulator [Luteitalea sp.]